MDFAKSGTDSIGMELEFQLLDSDSYDLVDGILPLMELCSDNQYFTPEFIQNTIEIASKKCFSIQELESHFLETTRELEQNVSKLNMRLCAAGTHPFSTALAHITPTPRYLKMEEAERYRSHTQITFATHVHLGMESAKDAITMLRAIKPFLPLVLALSANSPFWHGKDTSYASYRHRVLASTRSYGMPPTFNSWNEFEAFFDISKRAGLYDTVKDIHWDARPSPNLGTLEIRVMDAQSTVSDAVCRAAFLQALVYYLRDKVTSENAAKYYEYEYWLEKDNLYEASHLGLSAAQTGWHGDYTAGHSNLGLLQIFEEVLNDIVDFIKSSEKYKNSVDLNYLYRLRNQIYKPYGYQLQRNLYAERLSLKAVTKFMVERLSQELAV